MDEPLSNVVRAPPRSAGAAPEPAKPAPCANRAPEPEGVREDGEIGQRLRLRRRQKRLSLQQVADAAGISVGQLSQVERGLSQPSLRSLRLICDALNMPMSWLFEPGAPTEGTLPVVVRREERRRFSLGPGGLAKTLMSDDRWRGIQMMGIVIPPGAHSGERPYATGKAARTGMVLSGRLGLQVDDETFVLAPGDAFTFENCERCRFWCESEEACEVVWVVAPAVY